MSRRPLALAAGLATAALLSTASAVLLILAFRQIGTAIYRGRSAALLGAGGLLTASYLANTAAAFVAADAAGRVAVALRRSTLAAVLAVDPDASRRLGTGRAHALALDTELISTLLVTATPALTLGLGQIAVGSSLLLRGPDDAPTIAVIAATAVVVAGLIAVQFGARTAWTHSRAEVSDTLAGRLLGARTVRVQESAEEGRATGERLHARYLVASRKLDASTVILLATAHVTTAVLVILAAVSGDRSDRVVHVGAALLFGVGLARGVAAIIEAINAENAYRRLRELRALRRDGTGTSEVADAHETLLSAEAVTYRYRDGDGLTEPTTLRLNDGERLIISGQSGAGKSTLAELLSERRAASSGIIASRPGVRVIRVPQADDNHVFHASLLFNVLCGRGWPPTADDVARAVEVLKDLGLDGVVKRMPAGLAQPVGDGGWRMSAGETARLCLARALAARPDVLILDETTASLDPLTRRQVIAAVDRTARAVILISHQ